MQDDLEADLRVRLSLHFGDFGKGECWQRVPLVKRHGSDGEESVLTLEEALESGTLRYTSDEIFALEVVQVGDDGRYTLLTDDEDLIAVLDDRRVPASMHRVLEDHLAHHRLTEDAASRIMEAVQKEVENRGQPRWKRTFAAAAPPKTTNWQPSVAAADCGGRVEVRLAQSRR